jgi:hypothetical protein
MVRHGSAEAGAQKGDQPLQDAVSESKERERSGMVSRSFDPPRSVWARAPKARFRRQNNSCGGKPGNAARRAAPKRGSTSPNCEVIMRGSRSPSACRRPRSFMKTMPPLWGSRDIWRVGATKASITFSKEADSRLPLLQIDRAKPNAHDSRARTGGGSPLPAMPLWNESDSGPQPDLHPPRQ